MASLSHLKIWRMLMAKKPIHQFEDEIGELVDRYLVEQQITIDDIKSVLKHETSFDHAERLAELLKREERAARG